MIQITPQMKILVAIEAVDGRKGIDSLARLCDLLFLNKTWCLVRPYTRMASKASLDYEKLDSNTCLAFNRCVLICAEVRNPSCPWLTARSATCSNG